MSNENNWWVDNGLNYLKGSDDDPTNPPLLSDDYIVDFLRRIPQARIDLERIFPSLGEAEKIRITRILSEHPQTHLTFVSEKDSEDRRQTAWTRQGVYTQGKYGLVLFRG